MNATTTLYNALPYQGNVFRTTHPNHLAAVAKLYGLSPPPVKTARILELGCANGENLIPMAYGLPDATFIGIDFSTRHIATAQKTAHELSLANVTFQAADILTLDQSLGTFDYIICHGVYSWVPEVVQKKILDLCRRNLSPDGIAYISYNVYPGWHTRMILRDMMLFHTQQFDDPIQKIAHARAYVDFLAATIFERDGPLAVLLRELVDFLKRSGDYYILHEYLEPDNFPLHFYEFARHLADNSLDYLADTDFPAGIPIQLSKEIAGTLTQMNPGFIAWEQHLDFLRGRAFRKSLVVHTRAQPIPRIADPDALHHLFLATTFYPVIETGPETSQRMPADDPRLFSDQLVKFTTVERDSDKKSRAGKIGVSDPLFKNALVELFQCWPMPISLADLTTRLRERLRTRIAPELVAQLDNPRRLTPFLLQCARSELLEIHATQPAMTVNISHRPQASAIARREIALRDPAIPPADLLITTLRHQQTKAAIPHEIIRLADGTRTIPEIVAALVAANPRLPNGTPATRDFLEASVNRSLNWLARNALLAQ